MSDVSAQTTRAARAAGIDAELTASQWKSLDRAVQSAMDAYELVLQSSQGKVLARQPGAGLNYEAMRDVGKKFERWQREWKNVPIATRRHLENALGLSIAAIIRDGVAETRAVVNRYGPPKNQPRSSTTWTRKDKRPGGSRDIEPLRAARVPLQQWWETELGRKWSPQYPDHNMRAAKNAEAKLFLQVARECSEMLHGPKPNDSQPVHDGRDCYRALRKVPQTTRT